MRKVIRYVQLIIIKSIIGHEHMQISILALTNYNPTCHCLTAANYYHNIPLTYNNQNIYVVFHYDAMYINDVFRGRFREWPVALCPHNVISRKYLVIIIPLSRYATDNIVSVLSR